MFLHLSPRGRKGPGSFYWLLSWFMVSPKKTESAPTLAREL